MPLELATERFLLQLIRPEDQDFVFEGLSHPQVTPFYGVSYSSLKATGAQMKFYETLVKEETGCWWKIVDRLSCAKVGAIGYNNYSAVHNKAEIGYWLLPKFWKQGILTEVLPVIILYLQREKNIHRIEALIEEGNESSIKLVERVGFIFEGKMRDCEMKNGNYISLLMFSCLSTDKKG